MDKQEIELANEIRDAADQYGIDMADETVALIAAQIASEAE